MPEPHLREYQQFYQEQPFGLWRDDYRSAQIAYLLAAVNSDPKKSPPKLTDFMPFFADKSAGDDEDDGSEAFLTNR
ncbi:hypothetical protein A1D23_09250 [Chelonobacter oris]|nr:DUF4035 domain-containing protein [Chelonobacter oris]MDH3000605.1 hypothetical protein [Chelonobacter oris]